MPRPLFLTLAFSCLLAARAEEIVELDPLLEPLRQSGKLPGLAAAVVVDGRLHAVGAVGFRREGGQDKVTLQDRWHIGSCTKSMTATLAAMLVEEGRFSWEEKMPSLFPSLGEKMGEEWKPVTFEQLLAHRGGAPHDLKAQGLWGRLWQKAEESPLEQRSYLVSELLTKHAPAQPIGTFAYANSGYSMAGHAMEKRLGEPWEALITKRLFHPLGMASCGFGMPASPGKTDQPWGHARSLLGSLRPIPPGKGDDNPASIGPGGTVHLSITDFATYAAFHLQGEREGHKLLSSHGFRKLHTRFAGDGDYALGWTVTRRGWGGGEVLTHNGTNTTNYAVLWLAPRRNFAVAICTNAGGTGVDAAVDQVAGALVGRYVPAK